MLCGELFEGWDKDLFIYIFEDGGLVICKYFQICLGVLGFNLFELIGGFVDFIYFNYIDIKGEIGLY